MKQTLFISCPIETQSGYGARSRDIVKALIKLDKYDIKIISQRWGNTPYNALNPNNVEDKQLLDLIWKQPQLPYQPDIWMQVTITSEFQPVGKYNVGVSAGIETTICDPSWIEGCNRMDVVWVSSKHSKDVFEKTSFDKQDQKGNKLGVVKVEKPIKVLFEGVNLDKYFYINDDELDETELVTSLDNIKEDFCYLFVGHFLQGDLGEDRKNVGYLVKAFSETFKNKKNKPALILKTMSGPASIMDREEILKKIDKIRKTVKGDLPNIYLLHGEIEDKDMNDLYNHGKVKAMVNLTKGEGFGRPLLEFSLSKKPIIVSYWSGHTDFLDPDFVVPISGDLKQVHPSAVVKNIILAESSWFTPNDAEVGDKLKDVFENYNKYLDGAKRQSYKSKTEFSFDKMTELIDKYLDEAPKQVDIKLPTLPKLKKIN
jgi:hypothetical protein